MQYKEESHVPRVKLKRIDRASAPPYYRSLMAPGLELELNSLGSGSEGKREIVLNRRPELYRGKYRCVQPKINLLKRRSYACETQCFPVEPSGCRRDSLVSMDVPLRTAYSQAGRCGMQPKAKHSLRAQAPLSKSRTETVKTETLEKNFEQRKENARGARAGVTF
ncbi:hypothetical protein TNCV_5026961 [Trichonephila clavipes]|nr:hypothetical protein TNCV_5026961 [Trichonephila clavipes]